MAKCINCGCDSVDVMCDKCFDEHLKETQEIETAQELLRQEDKEIWSKESREETFKTFFGEELPIKEPCNCKTCDGEECDCGEEGCDGMAVGCDE